MRTGIRRKVDDLGRVVIPAGIRRSMSIGVGDSLEVHVEGDRVVLTKPVDQCIFCRSEDGLHEFQERSLCRACLHQIQGIEEVVLEDDIPAVPEPPAAFYGDRPLPSWSDTPKERHQTAPRREPSRRAATYAPTGPASPGDEPPASTTAW